MKTHRYALTDLLPHRAPMLLLESFDGVVDGEASCKVRTEGGNPYLRDDGTFLYVENTSIIHVSYEVKANWAYIVEGTYTIDSDDEGTKEVTLKGETVTFVMMGNPTTSEEDPELLEDYEEFRVEVDDDSFRVKLLDD